MTDQPRPDIETRLQRARLAPRNNRPAADTSPASEQLRLAMLAQFERFERERRAEIIAAGSNPDEDRDPFETVRAIADDWAATAKDADARTELLGRLADRLDTSEVRALRLAAEAAVAITPRLIQADEDAGVRAADTAADLGLTESYVYRVRREQRAARGDDGDPDTLCADEHPESELKWSARCQMSQGHSARRHRGEGSDGTTYDWPVDGYEISTRRGTITLTPSCCDGATTSIPVANDGRFADTIPVPQHADDCPNRDQ